jgi:hypothetical protein
MGTMEERVSTVERLLAEIAEANRETQEANREMREANREIQAESRAALERTRVMAAEIRAFVEERRESDRQRQRTLDQMDRQWGELANKMGTLVEDIVAPGLGTVFQTVFGLERLDAYGQRVRRTHRIDPGRQREFDYIASAGDLVLVNETKSTVRPDDIPAFVAVLREARDYLPEADGRAIVGALAGFSVEPSLVVAGERQGLLMFGLGTGLLRVLNTPGFQPRRF